MKKRKIYIITIFILFLFAAFFLTPKSILKPAGIQQAEAAGPQIKYYTCGMHPSVKVTPQEYEKGSTLCPICNMKLVPVYKDDIPQEQAMRDKAMQGEPMKKKVLFYRNPMNPAITSGVPAKDEMGMDYIPVYAQTKEGANYYGGGEEADKLKGVVSRVKVNEQEAQLAGVKFEPVRRLSLYKEMRTVGQVAYDPELAIAQEEFVSALTALDKTREGNVPEIIDRSAGLVGSAKKKLRLLGLSDDQVKELENNRQVQTNLILPEDKMWIYGDVYEYELSWLKTGQKVKVTTAGIPGEEFEGAISSFNPVVDPKTRSVTFRAQVDNPGLKLKPYMYVDVVIMSKYSGPEGEDMVLAIPKNAVLDTGTRRIVWVDVGSGEYEGRLVEIGPEATATVDGQKAQYYPVIKGLSEGELVVTKANFLIDSQSQISGVAASSYSGAIGAEEKTTAPAHQH